MADFYSVLKTSIVRRDLRSPADRREVYDQARKAMIRKLWSFDPPLPEEEIDARIGLFDAAVDRIEGDLELAFAEADAGEANRRRPRPAAPEPPRQPAVYEGYDEAADYAPAFGRDSARRERQYDAPATGYRAGGVAASTLGYDERRAEEESADDGPEPEERSWRRGGGWTTADGDDAGDDVGSYAAETYHDYYYDDSADPPAQSGEAHDREAGYWQRDEGRREEPDDHDAPPSRPARRRRDRVDQFDDGGYGAGERYDGLERKSDRRRRGKAGKWFSLSGRDPVRLLIATIAVLSAIFIAFNAYVFLPIILGPDATQEVPVAAPPKVDDRLPVGTVPNPGAVRVVSDSTTASEIPERNVDVVESLTVFDGRDPTVFEGASNNPIQFDSDAEGGFARVASTTSAAGARVIIGRGLAERLAGRTIRVTLLARSSGENGATSMRFAYQSGVAISHWQSADLSPNYRSYGMIWRVPAAQKGNTGDYLVIEPGIPGGGTSTDIRSIKIDILAS